MKYLSYILSVTFLLSSCADSGYKLSNTTFILKNSSNKTIYLKQNLSDLSFIIDTLNIMDEIKYNILSEDTRNPTFLKYDSIIVNFENTKFRSDDRLDYNKVRNLFNPDSYVFTSGEIRTYTFSQADYDAATPF